MGAAQAFHGCRRVGDVSIQQSLPLFLSARLSELDTILVQGNCITTSPSRVFIYTFTSLHRILPCTYIRVYPICIHLHSLSLCFHASSPTLTPNARKIFTCFGTELITSTTSHYLWLQDVAFISIRMLAQEQRGCEPPGTLLFSVFQTRPGPISLRRTD